MKIRALIIAACVVLTLTVFIGGVYFGGKSAEYDINKKIKSGEVFGNIDVKSLCQNNDGKSCNDGSNQSSNQNSDELSAAVQENDNEINALRKIGNDLAKPYIEEKIKDASSYKKINSKSKEEFLNDDFENGWDGEYLLKYKQEFSDAKKLRDQIMKGDIFEQDLVYGNIYYAQNYFNWSTEKLASTMQPLCDGLGCNVPTIISADTKYIYWSTIDCSGGFKPDNADQEFFYHVDICPIMYDAMMNYSKKD